jgi:pantoate--beta-alanine ligase
VKRLAADLDLGVDIVVCPTVREADGLAVSSRNLYLSEEERAQATVLGEALRQAAEAYRSGERNPAALKSLMRGVIEAAPLARIDYVELVDRGNFSSPGTLAVIAVRFGGTRLIDNHDVANPYPG